MTEDEKAKPTTAGTTVNTATEPDGRADPGTGTNAVPGPPPPDVLEALVLYAVARRDLYLADNLTRSA